MPLPRMRRGTRPPTPPRRFRFRPEGGKNARPMGKADVAVVGAGIVGLATAYQLQQAEPSLRVTVLEKESAVAQHQSGRNSGVLHSGIYYRPGSLKAENCRDGREAMVAFCEAEGIPHEICGKVIVAVSEDELPQLEKVFDRGQANDVRCEMLDAMQLADLEPHAAGVRAIHVPDAGIVDFTQVCAKLVEKIEAAGGQVVTGAEVHRLAARRNRLVVSTTAGDYEVRQAVNCAGLQSDRVARLTGEDPGVKIVPFRGEYYELTDRAKHLCKNLVYPVPNPDFPFLGVHFTRRIDGTVECGPNAVLATGRESYRKLAINPGDLAESLSYGGFLRMATRHLKMGVGEMWRSLNKNAFVTALQRLVPQVRPEDLVPARAGIRAQAIEPDGSPVDDFLIHETRHVINVLNAPSPAATSALTIGRSISESLLDRLQTD